MSVNVNEMISEYLNGSDSSDIGIMYGISRQKVMKLLIENGCKIRTRSDRHKLKYKYEETPYKYLKHKIYKGGEKYFFFYKYRGKERRMYVINVGCSICGNMFWAAARNSAKRRSCSKDCRKKLMEGENSCNWTGGVKYRYNGYKLIYNPDHHESVQGYVLEHRIIAEKTLGRNLNRNDIVHHINYIKDDNSEDNLFVLTKKNHAKLHFNVFGLIAELYALDIVYFDRENMKYKIRKDK